MADASRRFPPPWRAEPIPGGCVVRDANGQALAYSRDNEDKARQAKVLTKDEARRQPRQYRARLN
jgi:predicted type IV restriction endonuclease